MPGRLGRPAPPGPAAYLARWGHHLVREGHARCPVRARLHGMRPRLAATQSGIRHDRGPGPPAGTVR